MEAFGEDLAIPASRILCCVYSIHRYFPAFFLFFKDFYEGIKNLLLVLTIS